MAQLPQDGNLSDLTSLSLGPSTTTGKTRVSEEDDLYNADLASSFVPNAARTVTEQDSVWQSVQERQTTHDSSGPPTLMWPTIGRTPINEFTTEGYFSLAFPTLYPAGAADLLGQHQNEITIGYYFKHLIMYYEGRFAKHPRFHFFALNTEMRWRALQAGCIYVRQYPGDVQLSLDELHDMVWKGRKGFLELYPPLCNQSLWHQAELVQAMKSPHLHG